MNSLINDHELEDDVPLIQPLKTGPLGMIQFASNNVDRLVQSLITNVTPQMATGLMYPGMPAYLLFMAVRWTDKENDEKAVKELLSRSKQAIEVGQLIFSVFLVSI